MWLSRGFFFFMVQLVLNILWVPVFFSAHQIVLSCVVILLLVVFILLTMIEFYKQTPIAAWILLPYLLWTTYASNLNLYICFTN